MSLQDVNRFIHGDLTVCWWPVVLAVEVGVVRLVFLQDIVDGSQQHSGDSNDSFLVSSAFFERKVTISDLGMMVTFDGSISALY